MSAPLTILGIETSCDETAVAVLRGTPDARPQILSHLVLSQIAAHAPYGGVVPEIAARAHIEALDDLIAAALKEAELTFSDLTAIAATAGPGLVGGVIVGLMTAKGIAHAQNLPLVGVNHLEGHALSVRLTEEATFPYLLLLVSGGHCQLLAVEGPGNYHLYGATIDDAVGEAFDKTAKMLNLPYPGGPSVERAALAGDPARFDLPRPLIHRPGRDFSFSGLKTAVRHAAEGLGKERLEPQDVADLAASFQAAATDVLANRAAHAMARFIEDYPGATRTLVVAGGVAANQHLRSHLEAAAAARDFALIAPPLQYCTDNAAMIAWAGLELFALGHRDTLALSPRARWPLDQKANHPGAKV
ncbi:MAG: tRNA (adenosine(37)-N6)-threonylcarbamoyltransferase complex transferase subunit TsaD [Alphaproteobacteria bacterium]|nr:MAG: tRNA (adenosine(37)-N6)-threonylcarbamoyltransferase complex transferase subunit TsaD [Alphaproteobacteria bacterium]